MTTKIEILDKKTKLKNPILFVGLPGIGLVGKITVDYFTKELSPLPKLYASVTSDTFPPAVHTKNSIMSMIENNVFLYRTKKNDFLFLAGPVQPNLSSQTNSEQHYDFAYEISKFAKKVKVKEIYTFAGLNLGEERINKHPKATAVCTDEKTKKAIEKKKIKNLEFDKNNKDTLISGVAGLLPAISYYDYKIPGACIMGETNSKMTFGDHASAKILIEIITDMFGLKINLKTIDKSAKKINESFRKMDEKLKEINKKESKPTNYIR